MPRSWYAERLRISLGGKAATKRAEEAADRLCAIVAGDVLLLVHAAVGRVKQG